MYLSASRLVKLFHALFSFLIALDRQFEKRKTAAFKIKPAEFLEMVKNFLKY